MSYSQLSMDDRITIQVGLDSEKSINQIARQIGKSPSTVYREISKRKYHVGKRFNNLLEPCALKEDCYVKGLCAGCFNSLCKHCDKCRSLCLKYEPVKCSRLEKSPYTCNGCSKFKSCSFDRVIYYATYAHQEYRDCLKATRSGIDRDPEDVQELDDIVSPLLKKGQSVSHIFANHGDELKISRTTLYRYIDASLFTARSLDLPRKVKYRKRRKKDPASKVKPETRTSILSRNYARFQDYIAAHEDVDVVEMDTVEGTIHSKKCLLTLLFRSCNLMLAILLPERTQEAVISALNGLCKELGIDTFRKLFPVILTDRGSEFTYPQAIESDENGEVKTKVFYCDPQCSWQKGALEKNHEFIRYIVPKGKNFETFTQEDITLMINHINSLSREKYHGATPYMLSRIFLDHRLHEVMHLEEIKPDEVYLKPALLSGKHRSG